MFGGPFRAVIVAEGPVARPEQSKTHQIPEKTLQRQQETGKWGIKTYCAAAFWSHQLTYFAPALFLLSKRPRNLYNTVALRIINQERLDYIHSSLFLPWGTSYCLKYYPAFVSRLLSARAPLWLLARGLGRNFQFAERRLSIFFRKRCSFKQTKVGNGQQAKPSPI